MVIVSFITKNSVTRLTGKPITLKDVLNSTLQVPYKSLILVDDSEDDTRKVFTSWCNEHNKELLVTSSNLYGYHKPTRATARQTAIDIFFQNFNDGYLMFMDDDVILKDGWWKWIEDNKVLMDQKVGEIWGINWDASPEREKFLSILHISLEEYLVKQFYERGGTHDTVYRRKALEGIMIPPELHVYEDAFIHSWIIRNGWKSVVNPIGVIHYPAKQTAHTTIQSEKEELKEIIRAAKKYSIICSKQKNAISKIKGYLMLLRPVLGIVPAIFAYTRLYGLNRGVVEAFKKQYLKLWARWEMLKD